MQDSGHAILRSKSAGEDLVFIMKAGESWNHNHLDVGTCSYSNPLYREYYIQPCAHNSLTFEGQGQWEKTAYEGAKYPGRYISWMDDGDYKYLLADCTGPYSRILQRYYRHVLLFGKNILLVDDAE